MTGGRGIREQKIASMMGTMTTVVPIKNPAPVVDSSLSPESRNANPQKTINPSTAAHQTVRKRMPGNTSRKTSAATRKAMPNLSAIRLKGANVSIPCFMNRYDDPHKNTVKTRSSSAVSCFMSIGGFSFMCRPQGK